MRTGAFCVALGSLCLFLTACGGGGSSGSTIPVAPSLPAPAGSSGGSASPSPSGSPYPFADGDSLTYSGPLTQTFQNFPEVVPPGSPDPEPTSVTTINVTQNVTVKSNQSFNGGSGLYDLHSAETDAYASGLKTTTSTTDTYENVAPNGANSQLLDYGSKFVDEAGDSITTSYATASVLDQLPETPGAQWTNSAAASIQEAVAGNSNGSPVTVQRTINADGSYNETTTYPPDYSFPGFTGFGQITENPDGSGTYAWVANGGALTIDYTKPLPQPSGPPVITIAVYSGLDPNPALGPPNQSSQLPAWYGSAPALYGETDKNLGTQPVPSTCNLSSKFPQNATELQQIINRTDTVLGYTEQQTTTSYVASGFGAVCTVLKDQQTLMYDFNGDEPFVFTLTPPLEIITVAETLALQPGSNITGATASAQSIHGATPTAASLGVSRALRVSFDRAVSAVRRQHVASLVRAAQRLRARKGAQ
jgi:hypothetical protein